MAVKISIIIPAYNVAGYLETCLDSLLKQTFEDFEVILVDDGSTDQTPIICDSYSQKDSRITVIHQENQGVSMARNNGMKVAVGEYILFFDGDDFVEPYTCFELYELMKLKEVDTLIYGYYRYENNQIKETCYPIFDYGYYIGEDIIKELLPRFIGISNEGINQWIKKEKNGLYVENPALWRTMVSRQIIEDHHIRFNKNLKVGEDTLFITEYLSHSEKCYVHHKCYYYLVTRETSTIYLYEKNPLAKLKGKIKLLEARKALTHQIMAERQINIKPYWQGTVIMSALEIAFLLARKHPKYSYQKRYKYFEKYVQLKDVKKIVKEYQPAYGLTIRVIPLLLLKLSCYRLLFLCVSLLQLMNYEFKRN